jgi:hypothetical protein
LERKEKEQGEDPKQEKRTKEKNMKITGIIGKRNTITEQNRIKCKNVRADAKAGESRTRNVSRN